VYTPQEWQGFVEVWREAAALNHLVMDALAAASLPAIAFAPVASLSTENGRVQHWDLSPIQAALQAGLLPVVYGDVIFDRQRGGTILSTEDLFEHLALHLRPGRILLAGLEPGVWQDFPHCTILMTTITPATWVQTAEGVSGSAAVDVTGGMAGKVEQSLRWVQALPGLEVYIFSGEEAGAVQRALAGQTVGTLACNE
jgi:isopentenyl phosphate kinase